MVNTISLPEAIRTALDNDLVEVHTTFPGEIVSYDKNTQTATIRPMVKRPILTRDINDGEDTEETLPDLLNVPIRHPRGGGTFIHIPLTAGDSMWVHCTQTDISNWRSTGNVSSPTTGLLHDLSSCWAEPGAFHDSQALDSSKVSDTDITIGNGSFLVNVTSARVEFNGSSDSAALASRVSNLQTNLNALITLYNSHKHVETGTTTEITVSTSTSSTETFASSRIKTDS